MTSREALYNELEQEDWKVGGEGDEVRTLPKQTRPQPYTCIYSLLLMSVTENCGKIHAVGWCKVSKHLKGHYTVLCFYGFGDSGLG